MTRARIVIADDHPIVARGIGDLLADAYDVVAVVHGGEELVSTALEQTPDLALVDLSMPDLNGIEATRRILEGSPEMRVVVLTMHDDGMYAAEALKAGASGYVLKQSDPEDILAALEQVLAGGIYVSPAIAAALRRARGHSAASGEVHAGDLTERQREILALLVAGRSAKQIALELHLSRKTVEYHKYRAMERLGLGSTQELVAFAVRHAIGEI
jgi:DNA-binding NarL/FixJ family response regulator